MYHATPAPVLPVPEAGAKFSMRYVSLEKRWRTARLISPSTQFSPKCLIIRVLVGVRVRVRGGLLPTTSHSIFHSRVGPIAIFSHWQP